MPKSSSPGKMRARARKKLVALTLVDVPDHLDIAMPAADATDGLQRPAIARYLQPPARAQAGLDCEVDPLVRNHTAKYQIEVLWLALKLQKVVDVDRGIHHKRMPSVEALDARC